MSVTTQHLVSNEIYAILSKLVTLFHTLEKFHALDQSPDVIGMVEEVGVNDWMVVDAGATQDHRAPALGPQQCWVQTERLGKEVAFKQVGPDCAIPVEDVFYACASVSSKVKSGLNNLQI